jgi:hypothetical protein
MRSDLLHHFAHQRLASGQPFGELPDEELKTLVTHGACRFLFGLGQWWCNNQVIAKEQTKAFQNHLLMTVDDGDLPSQRIKSSEKTCVMGKVTLGIEQRVERFLGEFGFVLRGVLQARFKRSMVIRER